MILIRAIREARCDACRRDLDVFEFEYTPSGIRQFRCLDCLRSRLWDCLLAFRVVQADVTLYSAGYTAELAED